jgi:hypothetical protein
MSHWAEVDANNLVTRVVVGDNNDPAGDEGYSFLVNLFGGTWIKTSYNGNIRRRFAGIGFYYDPVADVFIEPKPFKSWTLNENYDWVAPTPCPGPDHYWDEATKTWLLIEQ